MLAEGNLDFRRRVIEAYAFSDADGWRIRCTADIIGPGPF